LENGDLVAIVGGGPAGSFFAFHLLRESQRLRRPVDVVIVEKRSRIDPATQGYHLKGCNHCAGIISPRMNQILDQHGLVIPTELIQGYIDFIWVHGQWKNFRLRVPEDQRMVSVFRGSMPARRADEAPGFDEFLLAEAIRQGARLLQGEVQSISYAPSGKPILTVKTPSAQSLSLEAGFVAIATGINAGFSFDSRDQVLISSVKALNPAFLPGRSRQALIFELEVGEDYLKRYMHREAHFIEYGPKYLPLEHTALVPKGHFLTVVLIGKGIDEAVLPRDGQQIIHRFLQWPQIDRLLPNIQAAPIACLCCPRMTVVPARSPFGDRFALIGDAAGSRLYKDGLFSAYVTATRLAQTVLEEGIDRQALAQGYGRTIRWLASDNRYGRMVFRASQMAFSQPVISRIMYQSFATELKHRDERHRPMGTTLWKIASGTADYRQVLQEMFGYRSLRSIFIGAAVTLRNVAVEVFFGLRWGEVGRYPTVVPKEDLPTVKQLLEEKLGVALDRSPDCERIYTIKIHGTAEAIMRQLARFGHPQAPFLNLRFIEVRHIQGLPNQVGSVIRYRIPGLRLALALHLTRKVSPGTLLYQVDERLADHGKLIFNVTPTADGNSELTLYTAFDYKRGQSLPGRIGWGIVRALFPAFVHDVVWNHALCMIKEEVERHSGGA